MAELKEADAAQLHQEDVDIKRKLIHPICRFNSKCRTYNCKIHSNVVAISTVQWIHSEYQFVTA